MRPDTAPGGGRIDNACGDTGHPLAVKQKMDDFRRPWKDLGGSWSILDGRFCRFSLIWVVDFGRLWLILVILLDFD